jgi:hypothetical protein
MQQGTTTGVRLVYRGGIARTFLQLVVNQIEGQPACRSLGTLKGELTPSAYESNRALAVQNGADILLFTKQHTVRSHCGWSLCIAQ